MIKKVVAAAAATGGLVLAGAGLAVADAGAHGAAVGSPGVASGNVVQVPVHVPVNVCGNTINVIGLLRSEPGGDTWKQTIAYPFQQMRRLARGQIIQLIADSDRYDSPSFTDVPLVDASATYDAEGGSAALFVANRSLTEPAMLSVDLRGVHATDVRTSSTLHAQPRQDRHTSNGASHDAVIPRPFTGYALDDDQLTATLPPLSWTVFDLEAARE